MVSKAELEMVIHAFISSRLDYCNSVFTCLNKNELDRLQTVQNAAARLLTHTHKRAHITPVLAALNWLPVHFRINFKILVLTFRALHGHALISLTWLNSMYLPVLWGCQVRDCWWSLSPTLRPEVTGPFRQWHPNFGMPASLSKMHWICGLF